MTGLDPTRWYNQVGVGARWQGSFGPVDAGVFVFYETASKESFFGPAVSAGLTTSSTGGATTGTKYDNLSVLSAAAFVKLNLPIGALQFAADYIGGAMNGQLVERPTGGAPMNAVVGGVTYSNGPITLGASVADVESQGAAQLTGVSQRHEFEAAFGGNYMLAPGLYVVGEYMYMFRHQGGLAVTQSGAVPEKKKQPAH